MKNMIHQVLWAFIFGFKHQFKFSSISLILGLLTSLLPALNVYTIGYLVSQLESGQSIILPIIFLALIFGTGQIIQDIYTTSSWCLNDAINASASYVYCDYLAKVPARFYSSNEFMELCRNAREAVQENRIGEQCQAVHNVLIFLVTSIFLCISLWKYNYIVALISLTIPFPIIVSYLYYAARETEMLPLANNFSRRAEYLQDQLSYDRPGFDLSTMRAGNIISDQANYNHFGFTNVRIKLKLILMSLNAVSGVIIAAMFAICLYVLAANPSLSVIFASITGLSACIVAMSQIGFIISWFAVTIPATKYFRSLVEAPLDEQHKVKPLQPQTVKFSDVKVKYGDFEAVKGVTLEIKLGSFTALVGENGSGKTSFMKAVMGIQENASGKISIDDTELDLQDTSQYLSYISVNQEYQRYDLTVRQFVTLGIEEELSTEEIWQALDKVEVSDIIRNLPDGLETQLGTQWGGVDLSGGQWQRLAVARGLLSRETIMYFDEPTSAIDAPTEENIFNHLFEASKQRLILVTSHRVSTLKNADLIYVMERGKIVEQGSFKELNKPGTYLRKMFESQFDTSVD